MLDHRRFLEIAIEQARLAGDEGCTPVGAVVVDADGEIVSVDRNRTVPLGDPTAHAEVMAVRTAGERLMPWAGGSYTLYSSGEPCLMCLGLVLLSPISTLVWAAGPIVVSGSAFDAIRQSGFSAARVAQLDVIREPVPELRLESRRILHDFFMAHGDPARAAIVRD
ncbi:MAG TPA: nucleoside deaminase [Candidatus Limnocylindrales bacterium]|nr:nucleoside deaminase [Candidatus Limnocylindrales bacterium]